jgi:hypothetical protein
MVKLEQYRESVVPVPGAFLEPHVHPRVIEGYDEAVRPIIKRLPLALGETAIEGLPT